MVIKYGNCRIKGESIQHNNDSCYRCSFRARCVGDTLIAIDTENKQLYDRLYRENVTGESAKSAYRAGGAVDVFIYPNAVLLRCPDGTNQIYSGNSKQTAHMIAKSIAKRVGAIN